MPHNTLHRESPAKKLGKYYTPPNLIDEMVKMTPDYFWSKTIFEPCAGDGRLVLRILNEKVNRRND